MPELNWHTAEAIIIRFNVKDSVDVRLALDEAYSLGYGRGYNEGYGQAVADEMK